MLNTHPVNMGLSINFMVASSAVYLTTSGLNLFLVQLLARQDRTPVNLLMLVDCLAGSLHSGLAIVQHSTMFRGLDWPTYCAAHTAVMWLFILVNRSVPVAIAVYRYLLVCQGPRLWGQETRLGRAVLTAALLAPAALGLASLLFLPDSNVFLLCLGREEAFQYNLADLLARREGGLEVRLPLFHPFRVAVNTILLAFLALVPALYYSIFRFRKRQYENIKGKIKPTNLKIFLYVKSVC